MRQFNTLAGLEDVAPHEEEWFTADEGLATIRALVTHLGAHPEAFAGAEPALSDLEGFAFVLEEAAQSRIRWHLCVDY